MPRTRKVVKSTLTGTLLIFAGHSNIAFPTDGQRAFGATTELCELTSLGKLEALDPAGFLAYGLDVAVDGDRAFVGSPTDHNVAGGAVYFLGQVNSAWVEKQKLLSPTPGSADSFGRSVAICGDLAVVDSRTAGSSGKAFVYRFNGTTWALEATLTPSDGGSGDWFGLAVDIDCATERVVVGAVRNDGIASNAGAAYVFDHVSLAWVQTKKLTPHDGAVSDYFGNSVSIDGDLILVGAPQDHENAIDRGAAYVYKWNGSDWEFSCKRVGDGGTSAYDGFGWDVALSGSTGVVGAFSEDAIPGADFGAAYVFDAEQCGTAERLAVSQPRPGDGVGYGVGIHNDSILIGAPGADDQGNGSGVVYWFRKGQSGWNELARFTGNDVALEDSFGVSVAVSGAIGLVGAPTHSDNIGAAYAFSLNCAQDCNSNEVPDDEDIANGTSDDCDNNGVPDECDIADCQGQQACGDCNNNGVLDDCDLFSGAYMMWYDGLGKDNAYNYIRSIGLARGQGEPLSPPVASWSKDLANPLLAGTAPNAASWYHQPTVLQESDGSFRMWMSHNDEIYHTVSAHGVMWYAPASVVPRHTFSIGAPWVIKDGPVYKMWFHAMTGGGVHGSSWIEYASSSDGYAWTKHGVVLTQGPDYDYWGMYKPVVVKDGTNSYLMYYLASTQQDDNWVALAKSTDGINWTKHGVVLQGDGTGFDAAAVFVGGALYENGVYWLFYSGRGPGTDYITNLGLAWSDDGVTFDRLPDPLMPLGASGEFDNQEIGNVSVVRVEKGISHDCNGNGVPDECDIADCEGQQACGDCNNNGIPDECEPDCNADGVTDECDADDDGDGVPDAEDVCPCSYRMSVDASGRPLGDVDGDCDVDLKDFQVIQQNFTGP